MKKGPLPYLIALIAFLAAVMAITSYLLLVSLPPKVQPTAFELNGKTYQITAYALNTTEQEKGLMNATVTNMTFMIFSFGNAQIYPFWMKNTYSQLDIMWVDYNASSMSGRIVYWVNATPCDSYDHSQISCKIYAPSGIANYVIETKAGFAEQNNLKIGDKIRFIYG